MSEVDIIPIPDEIYKMSEEEVLKKCAELKGSYGDEVVLLGHHYQRKGIVEISDFRGDSLRLSRIASEQKSAKYIVFCGVHFMAESAAILSQPGQVVVLPEMTAGCPMADMAEIGQVEIAWRAIVDICGDSATVPVTYMNSAAEIKAFCGAHEGAICTSSNAKAVMAWALEKGERVLFIPDEHLGRNSANMLDIPREQVVVWDPDELNGGNCEEVLKDARVILWKGFCHVHTFFTVDHVKQMRERFPGAKIIVHPECKEEVVAAADAAGSTGFIVKYIKDAPSGETIIVGTEINLVSRLADEYPDKRIYELARSLCPNMFKINPYNLYYSLLNIGKVNVVSVSEEIKRNAKLALQRMLDLT